MSISLIVWGVLMTAIIAIAYSANRLGEKEETRGFKDTGLAILEFGRAYPNEAIRQLHATEDGSVVFVRLHDNKAGFMRSMRGHYSCHLIEPGTVHATPLPNGKGLSIEFTDVPHHNGEFIFASAEEAAEVSLWMLGNFVPEAGRMADLDTSATS